jgi:hypothetical protein
MFDAAAYVVALCSLMFDAAAVCCCFMFLMFDAAAYVVALCSPMFDAAAV